MARWNKGVEIKVNLVGKWWYCAESNNIVLLENNTIRIIRDDWFICYLLCFKPVSKEEDADKVFYDCCLTNFEFSSKYLDNFLRVKVNYLSAAGRV